MGEEEEEGEFFERGGGGREIGGRGKERERECSAMESLEN